MSNRRNQRKSESKCKLRNKTQWRQGKENSTYMLPWTAPGICSLRNYCPEPATMLLSYHHASLPRVSPLAGNSDLLVDLLWQQSRVTTQPCEHSLSGWTECLIHKVDREIRKRTSSIPCRETRKGTHGRLLIGRAL